MRQSPFFDSVTQSDVTDRRPAGEGVDVADVSATIDHRQLYRLPWSLPDNAIAWLEPTKKCNLACLGCYRENDPRGHKTLDEVRHDLDVFERFRTVDGVSIAGGDPLVHPEIVEIVRMVARDGLKPIVNTNGLALTEELLGELKGAGVAGFTFHIDSKQGRPGWKEADEIELCELRQRYAEMVAAAGGMGCSFNATVYEDTLRYVPDVLRVGAAQHRDRQHDRVHRLPRGHGRRRLRPLRAGRAGRFLHRALRHHRPDSARAPVDRHRGRDPQALPRLRSRRLPQRDRATRHVQVAARGTPRRERGDLRLRRPALDGARADLPPPHDRQVSRLHPAADAQPRQGDAAAVRARPAPAHDRAPLAGGGCAQTLAPAGAPALPVGDDHPAGRHLRGRTPEHVRRLPRHDGVERPPRWSCRLEEPERFGDFVQMVPKSG